MRIWEVDDNKAVPSNLVREQDFILRVRRLNRHGEPYVVINIPLAAVDPAKGNRGPLEEAQERLQTFATSSGGLYAEMSNGDVFLTWPESGAPQNMTQQLQSIVYPDEAFQGGAIPAFETYRLPADYAKLRERANHYVDISRDASLMNTENTPSQLLQTEAARGPLTAWSVDKIEKLLQDIDLQRYVKTQPVYERQVDGTWKSLFEEWFVSFDELRRAHFPKMEITPSDHLFHEVCQALDRRLLKDLSQNVGVIASKNISLNLSIVTMTGTAFASFAYIVSRNAHHNIIAEVNCGDLLQDFSLTLNAMTALRRDGFRLAIDGVTPDMLKYMNFALFDVNYIKLNVSQERFDQLGEPRTREALMAIPRDKLIFYRCDNEEAYRLGLKTGATKFQGWYMDDMLQKGLQP